MNIENKLTVPSIKDALTKAAKMKGNNRGRKFTAGNQPEKRGRKPSRINDFIKAFSLDDKTRAISKEDAYKLLKHILFCNRTQLEAMARHADLPVAIVCQIKAIVTDIANGKTDTVDRLFDRLYGKSMQAMEITGPKGSPLIPEGPMSRKAYEQLLIKLQGGGQTKQEQ